MSCSDPTCRTDSEFRKAVTEEFAFIREQFKHIAATLDVLLKIAEVEEKKAEKAEADHGGP